MLSGSSRGHFAVPECRALRALGLIALASFVATLGVACGADGDDVMLGDGRYFAYVHEVDTSASPATIRIDVADFLTGDEANRAAVDAGAIEEGESVPNDYFVRNDDQETVVLSVARNVRVTHVQCIAACREQIPGRFAAFAASFRDSGPKSLADEYRGSQSQYWVTVQDREVVAIAEQYLP